MTMAKKPSMGRQKIKIAKIEIKNHLQVTFSKRRSGLFKKASELCTLCGVEIAIIVFSPAGKVFSFGHPNVEFIVDKLLSRSFSPVSCNAIHLVEAHRNPTVRELNMQLTQILNEVEGEKKRDERLEERRKGCQSHQRWWESPMSELGMHELEQLRVSMEDLKKNIVNNQAGKVLSETPNHHTPFLSINSHGGFDQFETKPSRIMVSSSAASHQVQNFGFNHAFF